MTEVCFFTCLQPPFHTRVIADNKVYKTSLGNAIALLTWGKRKYSHAVLQDDGDFQLWNRFKECLSGPHECLDQYCTRREDISGSSPRIKT